MPAKTAYTEPEWKIPGYSGCIPALVDTYKKTPVMAQVELRQPEEGTFLGSKTFAAPKVNPVRDPCNYSDTFHKPDGGVLWPSLQSKGAQDSAKPPKSNIPLGDDRIETYGTSYSSDFHAPFAPQEHLRSPMRNKDLGAAGADEAGLDLKSFYKSAYNRVGGARIKAMLVRMRDRFSAKLGNINDNGFRTRRLFKMYDRGQTGLIHFEDFRMMGESFGMQLDDDSLLALYFVMDPEGSGYLPYEEVVRQLLDDDYFAMYTDKVDNSLATSMRKVHTKMVGDLTRKLSANIADILLVFESFDTHKTDTIVERDFLAGCAALGVVFTGSEKDYIMGLAMKEGSKSVEYRAFCSLFSS